MRLIHSLIMWCCAISSFGLTSTRPTATVNRELTLQIAVNVAWYHIITPRINLMNISAVTNFLARVVALKRQLLGRHNTNANIAQGRLLRRLHDLVGDSSSMPSGRLAMCAVRLVKPLDFTMAPWGQHLTFLLFTNFSLDLAEARSTTTMQVLHISVASALFDFFSDLCSRGTGGGSQASSCDTDMTPTTTQRAKSIQKTTWPKLCSTWLVHRRDIASIAAVKNIRIPVLSKTLYRGYNIDAAMLLLPP